RIVRESDQDTPTLLDVIQEQQEVIKGGGLLKGLPTGIGIEKYAPGGIPRDKVTMLFADTGTFKTTICNHMKITMAMHSHRVLDCSLEDSSELTAHRYLSRESGVPYGRIASGELSDAERQRLGFLDPRKLEIARNIVAGDTVAPRIKDIIRK